MNIKNLEVKLDFYQKYFKYKTSVYIISFKIDHFLIKKRQF